MYADYLLASFGTTTATELSQLLEGEVRHDQVTRYLSGTKRTAASPWLTVKTCVRQVQSEQGVVQQFSLWLQEGFRVSRAFLI